MKKFKLLLLITICSVALFGCNNGDTPAEDAPTEEASPDENPDDNADNNSPEAAAPAPETPAEPDQTPVADKSPVAITRIEPPEETEPTVTGTGDPTNNVPGTDANNDTPDDSDDYVPPTHKPAPPLFPVGRCQVEVNGVYDSEFSKELVDAINEARVDYMIEPVTRNTSLLACADIRCKEQSYFVGHFRPDGSSWRSVAPDYVRGECIAVDYREAEDVVTAWLAVNKTRVELMNPFYTQIGTSVYNIDGTLFIAAEFSY